MIRAAFFQREGRLCASIRGHAGFAPAGKDIVCAGASALALTLATCLRREEQRGALRMLSIQQEPGRLEIQAAPVLSGVERLSVLLEAAEEGFRLLAREYPKHVILEAGLWNTTQK